jgi:hypothetical protein
MKKKKGRRFLLNLYNKLLGEGRIKIGGSAHNRLRELIRR